MDDIENLQLLVCELLDPNKAFYTKHGFLKPTPPPASAGAKGSSGGPSAAWKDALEVGSCFDAQDDTGVWAIVVIEQLSPTRTEAEIAWPNGKVEWVNLEDNPRVAEFGTKTGLVTPQAESESTTPTAPAATEPNTPVDSDVVVLATDEAWRQELELGSVLDCKDGAGTWYQVRDIPLGSTAVFLTTTTLIVFAIFSP